MVIIFNCIFIINQRAIRNNEELLFSAMFHYIATPLNSLFLLTYDYDDFETNQKDPVPAFLVMPAKVAAKKIVIAVGKRKRQITLTYLGKFAELLFNRCPSLAYFIVSKAKT